MVELDRFWVEHAPALRKFVTGRSADKSVVEDILQDAYVKAKSNAHKLRDPSKVRGWVYQICRATIADHYRSRRLVHQPLSPDLTYAVEKKDGGLWKVISEAIDCKIHHLPELYRGAISLFALRSLSEKEVADKLSISLPAAKARILRGRVKLRAMFERCCAFEFDSRAPLVVWDEFEKNIMKKEELSSLDVPLYEPTWH